MYEYIVICSMIILTFFAGHEWPNLYTSTEMPSLQAGASKFHSKQPSLKRKYTELNIPGRLFLNLCRLISKLYHDKHDPQMYNWDLYIHALAAQCKGRPLFTSIWCVIYLCKTIFTCSSNKSGMRSILRNNNFHYFMPEFYAHEKSCEIFHFEWNKPWSNFQY